jgi:hypothetical protein
MSIDGRTVSVLNEAYAEIELTPSRVEDLPIEVMQLRQAVENVRAKVAFDIDPFDFRAALLSTAVESDS